MVELLDGWLWEWGIQPATDFDRFQALVGELEAALGAADPELVGEAQKLFVKVKSERVRRGLSGGDVCPEGYLEELSILPEVVFPAHPVAGREPIERARALFARL
jgi:hypothetical protein